MGFDSRAFRDILGQFATGVCVITSEGENVPAFGLTVNSFASLSLDPPLVLWNLGKASDAWSRFENVDGYVVNILRESQQNTSMRFSKSGQNNLQEGEWIEGQSGLPVLKQVLGSIECKIAQRIDGGDHVILVGEVIHLSRGDAGKPLLFFGGGYRELSS